MNTQGGFVAGAGVVPVLIRAERRTGDDDSEGGADDKVELLPNEIVGFNEFAPGLFRAASSFASGLSSASTIAPVVAAHCTGLDSAGFELAVVRCDENHLVSGVLVSVGCFEFLLLAIVEDTR